jgi:hypothetical protein
MTEHRKEVRLAHAAFASALAGKWPTATRYVVRINDECGGQGLNTALMAWCDTYIDHALDGAEPSAGQANVGFVCESTGQLDRMGSENVPLRIQWAGRLMAARGAMDQTAWLATIAELPADGFEIGEYVGAVLDVVTRTINGLPRGFALMGRSPDGAA